MSHVYSDEEYHTLLLKELGVCEASDPARLMNIEKLEEHMLAHGINLPIVRRVTTEPTAVVIGNQDTMRQVAHELDRIAEGQLEARRNEPRTE